MTAAYAVASFIGFSRETEVEKGHTPKVVGPLYVRNYNEAAHLCTGDYNVGWYPNGTQIDFPYVRISISRDGGQTFTVYTEQTENDGLAPFNIVDCDHILKFRIKVETIGGGYSDINDADIEFGVDKPTTFDAPVDFTAFRSENGGYDISPEVTGDITNVVYQGCKGFPIRVYSDELLDSAANGDLSIVRHFSMKDACGRESRDDQHIRVITAPVGVGPLVVTSFNTPTIVCGNHQSLTWLVNGTDQLAGKVRISFSPNEGKNFYPIFETENDGFADVPSYDQFNNTARYKVETVGFPFVDTNDANITMGHNYPVMFTVPGDTSVFRVDNCMYDISPSVTGSVTDAKNFCGGTLTPSYNDEISFDPYCPQDLTVKRTWHVSDSANNWLDKVQTIRVISPQPLLNSFKATTTSIWPANNKYVEVGVSYDASDLCFPEGDYLHWIEVFSNNPTPDPNKPDFSIRYTPTGPVLSLLAAKGDKSGPRQYKVVVKVLNACMKMTTDSLFVTVENDKKGGPKTESPEIITEQLQLRASDLTLQAMAMENPTSGDIKIWVSSNSQEEVTTSLFDYSGKIIARKTGAAGSAVSFSENISAGIYIVRVQQGNEVRVLKVSKL